MRKKRGGELKIEISGLVVRVLKSDSHGLQSKAITRE